MKPLIGKAENGSRGELACALYSGPVGIRARGDGLEVAWFGRPPAFTEPVEATLDGEPVRIVALAARPLVAGQSLRAAATSDQAITATVERSAA